MRPGTAVVLIVIGILICTLGPALAIRLAAFAGLAIAVVAAIALLILAVLAGPYMVLWFVHRLRRPGPFSDS